MFSSLPIKVWKDQQEHKINYLLQLCCSHNIVKSNFKNIYCNVTTINFLKTLYSNGRRAAQTPFGLFTSTETSSSFIESPTPLFESSRSFTFSTFLLSCSFLTFTPTSSELKSVNGFRLAGMLCALVFGASGCERLVLEESAPEYVMFFDCVFDGGTFWDCGFEGGQLDGRGLEEGAGSKGDFFLAKTIIQHEQSAMFTIKLKSNTCSMELSKEQFRADGATQQTKKLV